MKSSKEVVYEYIQKIDVNNEGVETRRIAEDLNMQRSNVSALLNTLVKENAVVKTNTRPVLYRINNESLEEKDKDVFKQLIGYEGSLKNAVQLAKAAILYPNHGLNVLVSAHGGCGTSYFVKLMYQFAQNEGAIEESAPFIKINCRHYKKNQDELNDIIFGDHSLEDNLFERARGGVLFLDNIDILDAKGQSKLFAFLDNKTIRTDDGSQTCEYHDILLILACNEQSTSLFSHRIPAVIEIPDLSRRPIRERCELINQAFSNESNNSDRTILLERNAFISLLLSDYTYNIKELVLEIKTACANAFVRVVNKPEEDIYVYLDDFSQNIQRGLLKYKTFKNEIDEILVSSEYLVYEKNRGLTVDLTLKDFDLYREIRNQYDELSKLGVNSQNINNVINGHVKNLAKKYQYYHGFDEEHNLTQLSKIVDEKIINMVKDFLDECSRVLSKKFKSNVFYGLCLHVNTLIKTKFDIKRVNDRQISDIVNRYPREYTLCLEFKNTLSREFDVEIPIEEVVIITMFLIESDVQEEENHPVLLYIMHGNSAATSLKDVTTSLTKCNNVYSYDLSLHVDVKQAYSEIKKLIVQIDNGAGVIVIYDMGSIKVMLENIAKEVDVEIRALNIPITLIGIDAARRCSMETDIDYVFHNINLELQKFDRHDESRNEVIITLCHTGEGGAIQLKRYIDNYSKLNMKTIALSISDRDELVQKVFDIKKTFKVHCFVGTYDPKLFGIPFIPITNVFKYDNDKIDRLLMFEPITSKQFDYSTIYQHLESSFKYASIRKIKEIMPDIMDKLLAIYPLDDDQQIGLFMHITCLIERLMEGNSAKKLEDAAKFITIFEDDYHTLKKILKPIEKSFRLIIDDNEIAIIITMIKKL